MRSILYFLIISVLFLNSCETRPKKKILYIDSETQSDETNQIVEDTTLMLVGELPIYFDSTNYLVFPVGKIQLEANDRERGSYLRSDDYSNSGSSSLGYLTGYSYRGSLTNIYVQNIDSSVVRPLVTKTLKIRDFQFLESVRKSTGKDVLLLNITDIDTNNDKQLNNLDLGTLYLATLDGNVFKKLTKEYHQLRNWKLLSINNRVYFNTMEDVDKNGDFNNEDVVHYYFAELESSNFEVVEYNIF